MLDKLFSEFDSVVVLDTETTGVFCRSDEIIELAALRAEKTGEGYRVAETMDEFIRLSPGRSIPPQIVRLTGITQQMVDEDGISKQQAAEQFAALLSHGKTLVAAYNAQFDLCFLYFFLQKLGLADYMKGISMLDAMTVYKDRREYPHKLCNAVDAYQLQTQNTHRAIDDAMATLELLEAMEREKDDLHRYVNLFGFSPKYGVSGPRIHSVTYLPQDYLRTCPLYEKLPAYL